MTKQKDLNKISKLSILAVILSSSYFLIDFSIVLLKSSIESLIWFAENQYFSLIIVILPFIGLILSIITLILGIKKYRNSVQKKFAIIDIILSSLGILIGLLYILLAVWTIMFFQLKV